MASIFGHRRGSQEEKASKIMHPYVPRDADIRDYSENVTNVWVLVSSFAYLLFASVSVVVYLSTRLNRQLSRTDLCTIAWFALCKHSFVKALMSQFLQPLCAESRWLTPITGGSVHCAFEGTSYLSQQCPLPPWDM